MSPEYLTSNKNYWTIKRRATRAERIAQMGDIACVRCGNDDPDDLEFDHVDPTTKKNDIAYAISRYSYRDFVAELSKTQVLCGSCHKNKYSWWHYDNRNWQVRDQGRPPKDFNRQEAVWLGFGFYDD